MLGAIGGAALAGSGSSGEREPSERPDTEQGKEKNVERKESTTRQTDVLRVEFESLVDSLSREATETLQRFYRNKHRKQTCEDLPRLLRSEWDRISKNEQRHLIESRFGGNEKAVDRYLKPFFEHQERIRESVENAEKTTGVPAWVLFGVIGVESGGDPNAHNQESGAAGIMQIMPDTAKDALGLVIDADKKIDERLDLEKCISAGARYLARLHEQFGQWSLALVAYAGGGAKLRRRIKESYRQAGIQMPDQVTKQTVEENGVNIVTLYSREFCRQGVYHSVQYPFFVEQFAGQMSQQENAG